MPSKWVDNELYFGPDRRRRDSSKRWGDRRHVNDAAEPPPLGAVLRRLRVQLMDLSTPDDKQRALKLADLATTEAEQRGLLACADAVRRAAGFIREGDGSNAEAWVNQAIALEGGA